jgi:hypothetical protein
LPLPSVPSHSSKIGAEKLDQRNLSPMAARRENEQPQEPGNLPEMTPIFGSLYVGPRVPETEDGIPTIGANHSENRAWINGGVVAGDLFIVNADGWADDVFEPSYPLLPLSQVEAFVQMHTHLPDVPSASKLQQDGYDVHTMITVLMRKVEELTLYSICQEKKIQNLENSILLLRQQRNDGGARPYHPNDASHLKQDKDPPK